MSRSCRRALDLPVKAEWHIFIPFSEATAVSIEVKSPQKSFIIQCYELPFLIKVVSTTDQLWLYQEMPIPS